MSELPKANILVVDDTRANLRFLVEMLTQQGYAVRPALDGATALTSAQARPPDLILLDIMMPHLDGYAVCAQLKAEPVTCDIPVIFLSALNEVVDKVKAFQMGGVDYITKPFQVEEVLARVETHLALRALQRDLQEKHVALERYARELEASNAELDAFAHTVAHDLKTPLAAQIGFSVLLTRRFEQLPPDEVRARLALITQTGHKMTNIINELLLLAGVRKMEQVTLAPLDMRAVVAEVLHRLASQIAETQAEIRTPEVWPAALGYAPWIEEVWVNYLSNALKYGGAPPRVELGYSILEAGSWLLEAKNLLQATSNQQLVTGIKFWVRDNGQGLTAEQQTQLFAPFTRLHELHIEGYGLGLSIVRRIVEKLGGEVGVESQVGAGSTFWFVLPVAE